ncbi:hypothetical protein MVLG_06962 [Microbotryum lychnidis-dioicae p1A1 Lamole]|uniref:Helicase ATP-binding domain-containing protein n=1 Tax=Microbotryum lychnidis-dioicae (strain p1A1 Lamole / MvSl-1064) TaxID=683840 RepID=U5HIW4_USTV1|nr:hypothetical protein MVLG_06962 [Microbotryum lychnidis-dioicae p1A1 Lamole]|eukprot:KDE02482.1 hypothetical protein MVLG_06962 [Microbotryum lychnidis-dioicae p1A1 Lamole]
MHDIAQIKSLLLQLITFAYIDAEMLRIHSTSANPSGHDGAEDDARSRRMKKARELDGAYAEAAAQVQEVGGSDNKKESVALMFSFNDGELKSSNGVGKVITRKWQRKKHEKHQQEMQRQNSAEGKTPVRSSSCDKVPQYSKESMTSLIERRNAKFSAAVSELLVACAAAVPPEDPVTLLLAATDDNFPVKPGDEDVERKRLTEKREDLEFYQRNPDWRPSIEKIVIELMHQKEYRGQIVENGHRIFDARKGVYCDLDLPLSTSVWDALYTTKEITQLYSHQAQAINTLDAGHNVIVSTSTSSGKSLIYQLPALKELEKDNDATAMYIFPTKALAQDQKRALAELLAACGGLEDVKRNNILDTVNISSPPFIRRSHGLWIDVPASALEILLLKNFHPAASIHTAEHALMSLTPIVAMCTEGDVRTECQQPEKKFASMPSSRKRPARLILYDSAGMSGGICAKAFDHISVLIRQAADTIANCICTEGCPSCVASHMCSGASTIVSKLGTLVVLDSILNRPIDIDAIPLQEPAQGIVPGGSIDLAGAGVRRSLIDAQQLRTVEKEGVMEEEEISEAGVRERDCVLAELLGGGPGSEIPQVPRMAEVQERTRYDITKGGGFMSR